MTIALAAIAEASAAALAHASIAVTDADAATVPLGRNQRGGALIEQSLRTPPTTLLPPV